MKSNGVLKALAAFIGFVNALPAPVPAAELTLEDLLKLSEGFPVQNSKLEKRVGCNPDNLLRRLRDGRYSDSAGSFCSLFIQSTVTDTTEVAETLTTETETTLPPVTVTITEVSTLTDTDFSTSTAFLASTVYPYPQPQLAKRVEPIAYPSWLPATYPPSRVSSACSCFVTAPPPVIRTTKTIVTGTVTTFSETLTITPFGPTATESTTTVTTITSIIPVTKSIYCGITPACRKAGKPTLDLQTDLTKEQCFASCLATEGCLSIQYGIGGSVPRVCVLSPATVEDAIEPWVSMDSPVCAWWVMEDLECMYLD